MTYEIFNENHVDHRNSRKPFSGKYGSAAAATNSGLPDHG